MKRLPVYYKNQIVCWTLLDDQDYELVKARRWCLAALRGGYVRQSTSEARRRGESRYLSRVLLKLTNPKIVADHINHDPLDNRRKNLRPLSWADNVRHRRGPQKNNTNGHLGISYHRQSGGWLVRLTVNKHHYSKYSKTLEGAVVARRRLEEQFESP